MPVSSKTRIVRIVSASALFVGRPEHYVDQIDIVAHPGTCRARYHRRARRECLRRGPAGGPRPGRCDPHPPRRSIHSKLTVVTSGLADMVSASLARFPDLSTSGPLTRYCTGHPTGGQAPDATRAATGNSSASNFTSLVWIRLRDSTFLATITAWVKESSGSCTSSGR